MEFATSTTVRGRQHYRDLLADGQPVSHVVVYDLRMWILGVQVRMGGLGGVSTEAEHRMKGYSRRLMEDTVRYMTDLGQDVSLLFGIPDFYHKFGFAPCLVSSTVRVATRDAERVGDSARPAHKRLMTPADYPFVVDLYNEANRLRTGPVVREEEHFRGFRWGTNRPGTADAFVLEDPPGKPLAYAALAESTTEVRLIEANATDRRAFPGLLRELSRMAIERRCGHIELHMAADHPFVRFVRRCGCRVEMDCPRMGGGMMRILNQDSLFATIQPALADRLADSRFRSARVTLVVETDLGRTEFRSGPDAGPDVRVVVRLPQHALMQLLMGYRDGADVLNGPEAHSEGEAEALLNVLFEARDPYVWQADRF